VKLTNEDRKKIKEMVANFSHYNIKPEDVELQEPIDDYIIKVEDGYRFFPAGVKEYKRAVLEGINPPYADE